MNIINVSGPGTLSGWVYGGGLVEALVDQLKVAIFSTFPQRHNQNQKVALFPRCRQVRYCSREHQREDWAEHKSRCRWCIFYQCFDNYFISDNYNDINDNIMIVETGQSASLGASILSMNDYLCKTNLSFA